MSHEQFFSKREKCTNIMLPDIYEPFFWCTEGISKTPSIRLITTYSYISIERCVNNINRKIRFEIHGKQLLDTFESTKDDNKFQYTILNYHLVPVTFIRNQRISQKIQEAKRDFARNSDLSVEIRDEQHTSKTLKHF